MQFLITAYDAEDGGALERRMAARPAHAEMIKHYKAQGNMIIGAALLDENEKMIGSSIIVDFPSQEAVNAWLDQEPYIVHNVWEEVVVTRCEVAPTFADKL